MKKIIAKIDFTSNFSLSEFIRGDFKLFLIENKSHNVYLEYILEQCASNCYSAELVASINFDEIKFYSESVLSNLDIKFLEVTDTYFDEYYEFLLKLSASIIRKSLNLKVDLNTSNSIGIGVYLVIKLLDLSKLNRDKLLHFLYDKEERSFCGNNKDFSQALNVKLFRKKLFDRCLNHYNDFRLKLRPVIFNKDLRLNDTFIDDSIELLNESMKLDSRSDFSFFSLIINRALSCLGINQIDKAFIYYIIQFIYYENKFGLNKALLENDALINSKTS